MLFGFDFDYGYCYGGCLWLFNSKELIIVLKKITWFSLWK